jgi:DNA-binding CsgD family transcriptional regulator
VADTDRAYGADVSAGRHHVVGRDEELARISGALERGASVLLRGGPGIGKTALLLASAADATSVSVTGAGDLPLSAFTHLGDAEWRQPTTAGIAAALFRTTVRSDAGLLVVDDAHRLDPASAGLVLQLARSGTPMLAAARTGAAIPQAIQAVIRQSGETMEVGDLSTDSVRSLMALQLDAAVSLAFATAVAAKTGGNPLYVREVVRRVRAAGAARLRRGVWTLSGAMPVLDVGDLLADRIEELPTEVRFALELLSVAGSLPLHELIAAVGEATVSRAESEGVIQVTQGTARPGHPLQGDAALSRLPAARRERVHETLLAVAHRDEATPIGGAQRALWRLDGGFPVEPDELLDLSERVFSTSVTLAHRLASAAEERVGRPDQWVRLGALWVGLGEAGRADDALAPSPERFPPPLDVVAVGLRGSAAWIVHDRPAAALELLDEGVEQLGSAPVIEVQRAAALWRLGRIAEARAVAESVVRDMAAPARSRAGAAATLYGIAVAALDADTVARRAALVSEVLAGSDRVLSEGRATFEITTAVRHVLFEEDLHWAGSHLRGAFTRALERGEEREAAQYGWMLGWSLALGGRPQEAVETMPEFLELGGPWAVMNGGWAAPCYIRALVASGRVALARQELDRLHGEPPAPLFGPEVGLAEVDVLTAEGRRPAALQRARFHRRAAVGMGAEFRAVSLAWAELLLGGHGAAELLVTLTAGSRTPLHTVLAGFAHALDIHDPAAVIRGIAGLRDLGHRWHAVEAASVAATVLEPTDRQRTTLRHLYSELTDGQPPILARTLPPRFSGVAAALSGREREVAGLAAQGLSDRAIAERLVLSVRTVETHIAHVFAKTGLHRREDLSTVL